MEFEDWDYWISNVDTIEGLNELEKTQAKMALSSLKHFFGTSVQTLGENGQTYILHNLINQAAWTRKWFIYFDNAIRDSLQQKDSRKLIDKLKTRDGFEDALFELDIANRFIKSGFNIEFYPALDNKKIPDLKIINPDTDEEFFVELTKLTPSVQARESNDTFDRISREIYKTTSSYVHLLYRGKIHKYLSEPHIKKILTQINDSVKKCEKTGFQEIVEEGVIELAFANEGKGNLLREWASKRNIEAGLMGPSYNVDEIFRIGGKLEKEQEQLPTNLLNIVVILDKTLFFLMQNNPEKTIDKLEEYIYKHPHLAICAIIATYYGDFEDRITIKGDHLFLRRASDTLCRDMIWLVNNFITDKTITPNSLSKIRKAFMELREFLV